jgi:hypothetical protein
VSLNILKRKDISKSSFADETGLEKMRNEPLLWLVFNSGIFLRHWWIDYEHRKRLSSLLFHLVLLPTYYEWRLLDSASWKAIISGKKMSLITFGPI